MKIIYTDELKEYMHRKDHKNIIVELVEINGSEIEICELHVHFVDAKQTEIFKTKKRYRSVETEMGEVLLPHFVLKYEDEVVFGLKKFWIFHSISYKGIAI